MQRTCTPKDIQNDFCFSGTVAARGRVKGAWNVKLDVLTINQECQEYEQGQSTCRSMADVFPSFSTLEVANVKSYTMKVGDTAVD